MVPSFALTGQKMNPVLADTWSTQNKAVVMEGDYPNLAPHHTNIKFNHLKASALVSCYVRDKTMLFPLRADWLQPGRPAQAPQAGLLTRRGGIGCLTWPQAGLPSFRRFSSLPLKLKERHCWSEMATRSCTCRAGTLTVGIVILIPICCYLVVLLIERIARTLRQI